MGALGYCELVRNWRIAADLADATRIATSVLVNLGPGSLRHDVLALRPVLAGTARRLEHLRWADLLDGLTPPQWFAAYVSSRRLDEM